MWGESTPRMLMLPIILSGITGTENVYKHKHYLPCSEKNRIPLWFNKALFYNMCNHLLQMGYLIHYNTNYYDSIIMYCILHLLRVRYMIPQYTDIEQFFSINSEDGMITTTRPLDREMQPWHNISVSATEIGSYTHIKFPLLWDELIL